jgi:hypothetical protein
MDKHIDYYWLFALFFLPFLFLKVNYAGQVPEDSQKKRAVLMYKKMLHNLAIGCHGGQEREFGLKKLHAIFNEAVEKGFLSDIGKDVISQALGFGHTDIVDYFVKNNIKIADADGNWTIPLFWACRPDDIYYFNNKCPCDMSEFYHNWLATPLHWAAGEGDLSAVKYFIKQGISVCAQDCVESLPLDWALASYRWAAYHNTEMQFLRVIFYLLWQNPVYSLWHLTGSAWSEFFSEKKEPSDVANDVKKYEDYLAY